MISQRFFATDRLEGLATVLDEIDSQHSGNGELALAIKMKRVEGVQMIVDDHILSRFIATDGLEKINPYLREIDVDGGFGEIRVRVKVGRVVDMSTITTTKVRGNITEYKTVFKPRR